MSKKETDMNKCYTCEHRGTIPGDCHSRCNNQNAKVKGNPHGIANGWFMFPINFDPVWLEKCDGYTEKVTN